MKKLMIFEITALLLVLVALIIAAVNVSQPVMAPSDLDMTNGTPQDTTGNVQQPQDSQQTSDSTTLPPEPSWMTFPDDRELTARQYFVYDCDTNAFLTTSGTDDERIYPASITKLFTAFVAMQFVDPETEITAGDVLDLVAWGSSVAELKKGDVITADRLVEAMLLPSGNDAAYLLAEQAGRVIAGGETPDQSISASAAVNLFMEEMNEQAERLGMNGTHFVNPDGIHSDDHYTTFADLALLGELALANESVLRYGVVPMEIVKLREPSADATVSKEDATRHTDASGDPLPDGTVLWKNTNALIDPKNKYYCPYAIGLKTGQTPSAGSCLLSAFQKDGKTWLIGVFGCPDVDDRFEDTLQLFTQTVSQ